jgi:hypothetical protein
MADREQSQPSKRGMDEKQSRDAAGPGARASTGQTGGGQSDRQKERDYGVKSGGTVGREVPDQSKERNTEIAVEAGRKGGEHGDAKR